MEPSQDNETAENSSMDNAERLPPENRIAKPARAQQIDRCFVIMPISDPDGYNNGHFKHVYNDIIQPACERVGFSPIRSDEVKKSNLIHLDILQNLLDSPMAVCDLSTRNPNVLFELALRQAFDKPVALIQEVGTPKIFDISPLRYTEYRKERIYHEVLEDQRAVADTVKETFESHGKGTDINSIVKLLALSRPAALPEIGSPEAREDIQKIILAELSRLKDDVRAIRRETHVTAKKVHHDSTRDLEQLYEQLQYSEVLLSSASSADIERGAEHLSLCKHKLNRLMHEQTRSAVGYMNNDLLLELRRRLENLEAVHYHRTHEVPASEE